MSDKVNSLVVRVQDGRDSLGSHLIMYRLLILTRVELLEVELTASGLTRPQAQVVGGGGVVSGDRYIVGVGSYYLAILPYGNLSSILIIVLADMAVELDVNRHIVSGELPGVEIEPVVGHFDLVAVDDLLLEDTIPVSQTIAPGGVVERGKTVQETGSQTSKTAVTESGIALDANDIFHAEAKVGETICKSVSSVRSSATSCTTYLLQRPSSRH